MAQVQWWQRIWAATEWSKVHAFERWNQIGKVVVHSISRHSTTWCQIESLWEKTRGSTWGSRRQPGLSILLGLRPRLYLFKDNLIINYSNDSLLCEDLILSEDYICQQLNKGNFCFCGKQQQQQQILMRVLNELQMFSINQMEAVLFCVDDSTERMTPNERSDQLSRW